MERTARNASRKTSTASAEANNGRRFFVTKVKKNEPPATNARRYLIVGLPLNNANLSVFSNVGLRFANPTYETLHSSNFPVGRVSGFIA